MPTITKHNDDLHRPGDPPVPPPAYFNEHEMAIAKPVQPLPQGWRRPATDLRILFFRHVNLICMVIAAFAICGVLANTFADRKSSMEVARDESTEPVDDSTADAAAAAPMSPAAGVVSPQSRKIRNHSIRRLRRSMPMWEFNPGLDDGRPRPRLVGTIHQ